MKKFSPLLILSILLLAALGCSQAYLVLPTPIPPTPTSPVTPTLLVTPSDTPTIHPAFSFPTAEISPTPAPPTPTPIPNWIKFSGGGVELWLPNTFKGGDYSVERDNLIAELKSLGDNGKVIAANLEANKTGQDFLLYAVDTVTDKAGIVTTLSVSRLDAIQGADLSANVEVTLQRLGAGVNIQDRQAVSLNGFKGQRLVVNYGSQKNIIKEVFYFMQRGEAIWLVTFVTSPTDYDKRLPVIDQGMQYFFIQP